ncbi:hypothetical protein [Niveibacterium terrae]|uniref:hypothetical protein n=1 Tax=Niveibacterium terrae TaxID=3373598 RepID=UPI003A9368C4
MSGYSQSPRVLKGGLILLDADSAQVQKVIALQYNSDTLSRSLQVQTTGAEAGRRSEAVRFTAPAIETIRLEAEIDATDHLEFPDQHEAVIASGIAPQLAQLELLAHPGSAQLLDRNRQAQAGTLEIAPIEAPLLLFVWGRKRIVPVRISEFAIVEEAFDPLLNPIRARVTLALRVLSVEDLGFAHRGGGLFIAYLQAREKLAASVPAGSLSALGLGGL